MKNQPSKNHRSEKGNSSPVAHRYLCGVPKAHCTGSAVEQSGGLGDMKSHSSPQEVYLCELRYWRSQGYEYIGGRMMRKEGEPIQVLPRKMRAGKRLKPGKAGRSMPENKDNCGGLVR